MKSSQYNLSSDTIRYCDAYWLLNGGMSGAEVRRFLKAVGYTDTQISIIENKE